MVLWQVIFWAVISVVLFVVELCSSQLVSVWFALSALASFGLAFTDATFTTQLVIFAVLSAVLIVLTRPITKKIITNKTVSTNADALIGCECSVLISVTHEVGGRVSVNGKDWSARIQDESEIATLEVGSKGVIQEIKGVTLIVKPLG